MQNLMRASDELFRRGPDECFATFDDLYRHCAEVKEKSRDRWHQPSRVRLDSENGWLRLMLGNEGAFRMNNWSFSQLCGLAGVHRDTVNKLSAATASQVFAETLSRTGNRHLQVLTTAMEPGEMVRAIHGAGYTRLYDADLLSMVREFATDFQPPQQAKVIDAAEAVSSDDIPFVPDPPKPRGTGLYRGEQDMFVFLIDPTGWTEINGEAFAPGFFLWF